MTYNWPRIGLDRNYKASKMGQPWLQCFVYMSLLAQCMLMSLFPPLCENRIVAFNNASRWFYFSSYIHTCVVIFCSVIPIYKIGKIKIIHLYTRENRQWSQNPKSKKKDFHYIKSITAMPLNGFQFFHSLHCMTNRTQKIGQPQLPSYIRAHNVTAFNYPTYY